MGGIKKTPYYYVIFLSQLRKQMNAHYSRLTRRTFTKSVLGIAAIKAEHLTKNANYQIW